MADSKMQSPNMQGFPGKPMPKKMVKKNHMGMVLVAMFILAVILGAMWVARYYGLL